MGAVINRPAFTSMKTPALVQQTNGNYEIRVLNDHRDGIVGPRMHKGDPSPYPVAYDLPDIDSALAALKLWQQWLGAQDKRLSTTRRRKR